MPVHFTEGSEEQYAGMFKKVDLDALKLAVDARKTELDLYWKRASYYWVFLAGSLAGYFGVAKTNGHPTTFSIVLSVIGIITSVAWYMVNRGSKAWQVNWEEHVRLLSKEVYGNLFATQLADKKEYRFWKLTDPYNFSVTKINQWLGVFIIVLWIGIFLREGFMILRNYEAFSNALQGVYEHQALLLWIILGLGALVMIWILYHYGRHNTNRNSLHIPHRKN